MKKICTYILCLIALTLVDPVDAGESAVTQVTLSNGMRVWLKPTANEPSEVSVHLVAEGGFSMLPEDQRGAGELAMQVAYESGFGGMTPDQISRLCYEHSIEFQARTLPFNRVIEATTDTASLPYLFALIKGYFVDQKLTQKGFETVMRQNKEGLSVLKEDAKTQFEDAFKVLNTQNFHFLKPFKIKYLDKAQFEVVQNFLDYALADPSQFICVIVGDFQVDSVLFMLKSTLAQIPVRTPKGSFAPAPLPTFPTGVTTKVVAYPGRPDCLSRITFPLLKPVTEVDAHAFDVGYKTLEKRLRDVILKKFKSSMSLNVSYELPLYPTLKSPWLVVQFRSDPKQRDAVHRTLLEVLEEFQATGPTQQEIDLIETNIIRNEEFWMKENDYLVATLSNYALWGWNPQALGDQAEPHTDLAPADVQKRLLSYIPKNNYTWIYTQ